MDADLLRKAASAESGRRFLENYGQVDFGHISLARMQKAAHADQELLKVAAWCSEDSDTLEMYELLGGDYEKQAFGAPMFDSSEGVGAPKLGGPVGSVKPPGGGTPAPKAPSAPSAPSMGKQADAMTSAMGMGRAISPGLPDPKMLAGANLPEEISFPKPKPAKPKPVIPHPSQHPSVKAMAARSPAEARLQAAWQGDSPEALRSAVSAKTTPPKAVPKVAPKPAAAAAAAETRVARAGSRAARGGSSAAKGGSEVLGRLAKVNPLMAAGGVGLLGAGLLAGKAISGANRGANP